MYRFPEMLPKDNDTELMKLQTFLMIKCQNRFGDRDHTINLGKPLFIGDRPCIYVEENQAYAALSDNASSYWPTTLYELAHETVHLLNPAIGDTNYLEEGLAVAFSVEMSKQYTAHPMGPNSTRPESEYYREAWKLVSQLDKDIYKAARKIRSESGSLKGVSTGQLQKLFPKVKKNIIEKLSSEFNFK